MGVPKGQKEASMPRAQARKETKESRHDGKWMGHTGLCKPGNKHGRT